MNHDEEVLEEVSQEQENLLQNLSLKSQVEALIFASPKALSVGDLLDLAGERFSKEDLEEVLQNLVLHYKESDTGIFIELTATGEYQFRTKSEYSPLMEKLFSTRPRTLSRAAQETLAIIAYRQPVTRADIEFIRGVDAGSIIKNLLDRDLVKCVGRKEEVGRPMLFGTTHQFLNVFQISKISDLPPLESFQPSKEVLDVAAEKSAGHEQDNML